MAENCHILCVVYVAYKSHVLRVLSKVNVLACLFWLLLFGLLKVVLVSPKMSVVMQLVVQIVVKILIFALEICYNLSWC